jgi:hypothetical protein
MDAARRPVFRALNAIVGAFEMAFGVPNAVGRASNAAIRVLSGVVRALNPVFGVLDAVVRVLDSAIRAPNAVFRAWRRWKAPFGLACTLLLS